MLRDFVMAFLALDIDDIFSRQLRDWFPEDADSEYRISG